MLPQKEFLKIHEYGDYYTLSFFYCKVLFAQVVDFCSYKDNGHYICLSGNKMIIDEYLKGADSKKRSRVTYLLFFML